MRFHRLHYARREIAFAAAGADTCRNLLEDEMLVPTMPIDRDASLGFLETTLAIFAGVDLWARVTAPIAPVSDAANPRGAR